ncbi:tRNA-splicing endonuclease subunit sen54, variant 5 [Batrachochytrium dendrobatidis]|nr:tRNA-splicing endonuclease subunit sen54, variant 5 [Batrachochytrium dendrobatidis]
MTRASECNSSEHSSSGHSTDSEDIDHASDYRLFLPFLSKHIDLNHSFDVLDELQRFDHAMLQTISVERRTPRSKLCLASWVDQEMLESDCLQYKFPHAQVSTIKGLHFKSIGKALPSGKIMLLPEETLFLIDQGALVLEWHGGRVTVQHAYSLLLGNELHQIPLVAYQVYAYLKRLGFYTFRCDGQYNSTLQKHKQERIQLKSQSHSKRQISWWESIKQLIFRLIGSSAVVLDHKLEYPLNGIKYEPSSPQSPCTWLGDRTGNCILWHVYKPLPKFKKSDRKTPDFAVVGVQ